MISGDTAALDHSRPATERAKKMGKVEIGRNTTDGFVTVLRLACLFPLVIMKA